MKSAFVSAVVVAVLAVSCSKEGQETLPVYRAVSLESVFVPTRGFSRDSAVAIGITLVEAGGKMYNGQSSGYSNIRYAKEAGEESWGSDSPIMMSSTPGVLYAYCPYSTSVTDIRKVPVRSSLHGTDYMYADSLVNVSSANPDISLTLHHALAQITVRLWRDSTYFSGACELSAISISGDGVAVEGTLNAMDGTIAAAADTVSPLFNPVSFSADTVRADYFIVPAVVSGSRQNVLMKCTIDGTEHGVSLTGDNGVVIGPGVNSIINLCMKGKTGNLTVIGVGITGWNADDGSSSGTSTVESGLVIIGKESCENGGEIVY